MRYPVGTRQEAVERTVTSEDQKPFWWVVGVPVRMPFFSGGSFQLTLRDVSRISVKLR